MNACVDSFAEDFELGAWRILGWVAAACVLGPAWLQVLLLLSIRDSSSMCTHTSLLRALQFPQAPQTSKTVVQWRLVALPSKPFGSSSGVWVAEYVT